jgi:hypothetical protein
MAAPAVAGAAFFWVIEVDPSNFTVETTNFDDIAAEFHARVSHMVWCNVASVDDACRPRSRIMHPIWEGKTGWIGTWLTSVKSNHEAPSLKIRQLRNHPFVSLAYVADVMKPVYVDCHADVHSDPETKRHFTDLAGSLPLPYGYDAAELFGGPEDPRFGVLRLEPLRIALVDFPAPPGAVIVWTA